MALRETLDELAPEITKQVTIRKNNPWFTEEIKTQKHVTKMKRKDLEKVQTRSSLDSPEDRMKEI